MNLRKILVPVDYSECSSAALAFAANIAQVVGAELHVVSVWDRPSYVTDSAVVRHPDGTARSIVDMVRESAEADFDEFVTGAKLPSDLRVQRKLLAGNPATQILAEVEHG